MSYDIYLYNKQFLKQALQENLGDWTNAPTLPNDTLLHVREWLATNGYILEFEDKHHQEYSHSRKEWGLQVSIFASEVAFSIPYWEDASNAISTAKANAKELARETNLAFYDPQEDEVDIL